MAQKRSANTYQKINTIFKRDENNIIMPHEEFSVPELNWLRNCKFDATEKINGTSIRIEVTPCVINEAVGYGWDPRHTFKVAYKGKTDNTQVPTHLMKYLEENYSYKNVLDALQLPDTITEEWMVENGYEHFENIPRYTIYGEGYGVKIQKGGNYIKDGVGFIVFDVKVGDMYLLRDSMEDIAGKLGAPVVPYMGQFTIDEAIEFVKKGFKSTIADNKDYDAEGLVLKTPDGLCTRRGERIIFKVKTCDFIKYKNKYGNNDKS